MAERQLRVVLYGRPRPESTEFESMQGMKENLRGEAKKRDYLIVGEFWEEDASSDTPLDERPVMKQLINSIWNGELNMDGLFVTEISELGWTSRKEHVTFMMLFEQNNLALITLDAFYHPDEWLAAFSF